MRPTGNCSPALEDRDTDLVAGFAFPRPPEELIAASRWWGLETSEIFEAGGAVETGDVLEPWREGRAAPAVL